MAVGRASQDDSEDEGRLGRQQSPQPPPADSNPEVTGRKPLNKVIPAHIAIAAGPGDMDAGSASQDVTEDKVEGVLTTLEEATDQHRSVRSLQEARRLDQDGFGVPVGRDPAPDKRQGT